ncbi:hypothetical protein [Streptomyces sp. NPDC058326]
MSATLVRTLSTALGRRHAERHRAERRHAERRHARGAAGAR